MGEGPKVNVLLVDDQPAKLLSYEAVLSDLGENLIKAGSAREALDLLLKHDIAVILVDVCMPEFDGFDLVDMIRQHPRFDATAIILVSAVFMSDVDRIRGYERGAMDYVSVPIVPELLRAKVATFAELYRKTRQLELLNERLELRVAERTAELEASTEAVRAGEERLSLALSAGAVATWVWEIAEDRVSGDDRLATFFGADPQEVERGLPLEALVASVHEEDRPVMLARLQAMIEGGDEYVMEFRVLSADRTLRWLRARGRVERDGKGNARVVRGALTDITEAMRLEQALRDADRRKDHFLAVLSHELRNPLASIRNVVELMRAKTEDGTVVAWGRDVIERQVGQLVRLVDDLLDVSRITAGKLKLRSEPVDLGAVAASALETSRPLIDRRRHAVTLRLGDRPVWVLGDPVRLTQIVTNLLNNAAKFQEPGGEITLAVEREGSQARISVKDRGQGIPPELLPGVFEMFTETGGTGEDSEGGLGLGLSLVRRLVELHAGSTEVRSEGRGCGSEFIVRLPCLLDEHRPAAKVEPRAAGKVAPQRILVVDDNHDAAESLGILLRRAGHQVVLANEGESALRAATKLRPSVVLLDLGLPGMNGLELCRRLRQQGLQDTLMVAVTGYGQESDRTRTREAGFDSHLVKPVAFDQLVELVASAPHTTALETEGA
jgi:PAS domain S-box-containing protein